MSTRDIAAIGKEMNEVQLFAIKAIFENGQPAPKAMPGILQAVLDCSEEEVCNALGNALGSRIKRFATDVDFEHPGFTEAFEGSLNGDSSFSRMCCEVLHLSQIATKEKMHVAPKLYKLVVGSGEKSKIHKEIERCIDSPSKNQLHVRFMKTRAERDAVRETKRMQVMAMATIAKKGMELWDSLPDSFVNYARGRNIHEDTIKDGNDKAGTFESLGLAGLAGSIKEDVSVFQQHVDDAYYGFNRISMTAAAVVQAKILGFTMQKCPTRKNWTIQIPLSYFGDFKFYSKEYTPDQTLEFNPRSYTFNELASVAPEKVVKIIDRLEAFPDFNGKALFDHYRVLVPTVNFPNRGQSSCSVVIDGETKVGTYNEVSKILDKELIVRGYLNPILLGEKNENCYFIGYWC